MNKERTKHPKVPVYPANLAPQLAELELQLVAGDPTAYMALTRLAVLWAPNAEVVDRRAVIDWLHLNY